MQPQLGGPRAGLALADVVEAESLMRGAQVRHGVDVLTRAGVLTDERVPFVSGSVSWSYRPPDPVAGQANEVAAVRRRATLQLAGPLEVDLQSRRLQVWTELRTQFGAWARYELGVFDAPRPVVADDGTVLTRTLELADKTHRWSTTLTAEPVVVPESAVAVTWVRDSLSNRFGETGFSLPTSTATVGRQLVLEPGTSWLEVYSRVLRAAGFDQLTADEGGRATTRLLSDIATRGVEVTYGPGAGKVVRAGQVEPLSTSLPNVVRFVARQGPSLGNVEGNGIRTVLNQSSGPASIDARGGTGVGEVELRVEVDATSQAVLDAVAAAEAQRYFAGGGERWSGRVGLQPRHSDRDVIELKLPRLGLTGAWLVTSWTYPLGPIRSVEDSLMPITAERRIT